MMPLPNYCRGEARAKITGKGLTDSDVRAIRALPGSGRSIAEQFGISEVMVHFIKRRKRWAHVKDLPVWIGAEISDADLEADYEAEFG